MKFAHKGFIVSVTKATENEVIETKFGSLLVLKDELIIEDGNGKLETVSEELFDKYYIPVEEVVVKEDSASSYEAAYKEFSLDSQTEEDSYLDGTAEINGIKHTY